MTSLKEVVLTGPELKRFPGRYLELRFDSEERLLLLHRRGLQRGGHTTLRAFAQPARASTLSPDCSHLAWMQQDDLWAASTGR